MTSMAALPEGGPPWLTVAGGVVLLIVALFGQYPVKAAVEAVRAKRAGVAARETEAREQVRQMRREHLELTLEAITEDNVQLRQRVDELERHKSLLWDHIGQLEADISTGRPPPPRRRPRLENRRYDDVREVGQ